MDLFDASAERMRLRDALAEMFQKAMPALQNASDEFLSANVRNNFHRGQPLTGVSDVQTQPLGIIGKYLASFPTARDADVKLLLADRGQ